MNLNKRMRLVLGFVCMLLGVALMGCAAAITGEPGLTDSTKGVAATVFAVGGGVLTFVVARRLLTSPLTSPPD